MTIPRESRAGENAAVDDAELLPRAAAGPCALHPQIDAGRRSAVEPRAQDPRRGPRPPSGVQTATPRRQAVAGPLRRLVQRCIDPSRRPRQPRSRCPARRRRLGQHMETVRLRVQPDIAAGGDLVVERPNEGIGSSDVRWARLHRRHCCDQSHHGNGRGDAAIRTTGLDHRTRPGRRGVDRASGTARTRARADSATGGGAAVVEFARVASGSSARTVVPPPSGLESVSPPSIAARRSDRPRRRSPPPGRRRRGRRR